MGMVQNLASLLLLLLLLLNVIYDGVGMYNETIVTDCYVDDDDDDDNVDSCQPYAHPFPKGQLLHFHSKQLRNCW